MVHLVPCQFHTCSQISSTLLPLYVGMLRILRLDYFFNFNFNKYIFESMAARLRESIFLPCYDFKVGSHSKSLNIWNDIVRSNSHYVLLDISRLMSLITQLSKLKEIKISPLVIDHQPSFSSAGT